MEYTVKELIQSQLRQIERCASRGDDERAAELEVCLYRLTLEQIVENLSVNSRIRQWAEVALEAKDIDFERMY